MRWARWTSSAGKRDVLKMFEEDPETKAIVLIGEIGGTKEQSAAEYISSNVEKPVIEGKEARTLQKHESVVTETKIQLTSGIPTINP